MYRKILVPVDASTHSLKALEHAADMARIHGARLVLLHVIARLEVPEGLKRYVEVEGLGEHPEAVYTGEVANRILGLARERLKGRDRTGVDTVMAHGDPARTIVAVAAERGVDAIVMGTRGLSDIQGLVLGSVAHRVMHLAPCTVITVK